MLARRSFLAFLGLGAGAATAVALKTKPALAQRRYVGTYLNIPVYESDEIETGYGTMRSTLAAQAEINLRRSKMVQRLSNNSTVAEGWCVDETSPLEVIGG